MARIRSVHPELFTDEAFVEIGYAARILLIGLGTQADDQGVFQWKPTGLRLRLMPGDMVDVQELLAELVEAEFVMRYRAEDGREFGAIRNFCRHQKPKRPNAKYPITPEVYEFVSASENSSLDAKCSEHVGNQFGTCSPGEEGRGEERRGGDKGNRTSSISPPSAELKPEQVVEKWNAVAKAIGKPTVLKLSSERRAVLKQRIAQNSIDDFRRVFANIKASPFLRGDTGWHGCNFDWVFKKLNFQKILEGNYRDK